MTIITGPITRQITQRGTGAPVTHKADRPNQTALKVLLTLRTDARNCSNSGAVTYHAAFLLDCCHNDDNFYQYATRLGYQLGFLRVTSPLREVRS